MTTDKDYKERDKLTVQVVKKMVQVKRPPDWHPKKDWHKWVYAGAKKNK